MHPNCRMKIVDMRYRILVVVLLCSIGVFAQENTTQLNWLTNLEEAKALSKEQKKPILVYFTGSDWCSPCKKLKEDFFDTPEFGDRAEDMVLVMIDYPRGADIITPEQMQYNKKIISQYNKRTLFPKLLALDHNGTELGEITGYGRAGGPGNHFKFVNRYLSSN